MATPKKILLATDLSGRGDRALDRACQLALAWDAELLVVHALENEAGVFAEPRDLPSWRRPPAQAARVEAQIRDDIRGECPRLRVHVQEGEALRVIFETLERERCDFVVIGLGRPRPFSWYGAGKIADELFRRAPVSVLIVKRRPQGAYRHVLVGTDFTDEARVGLEVAVDLFGDAQFTVMHAFEMPYRALLLDTPLSRDFGEMERAAVAEFVAAAQIPSDMRPRVVTLIEHGPPERMLGAYVSEHQADLTVIGAYERGRLFHTVIGGKGPRIVEAAPSDVLVVRAQRGAPAAGA